MARKVVAIVQSCYIPWRGYFDLINRVDEFILYDDRQFTRRDWRNRNRIKTPQGTRWLTIPVRVKGRYHQRIDETLVSDPLWGERHWRALVHSYARAPCFDKYAEALDALYRADGEQLSEINRCFIEAICGWLGIETRIRWSTDYKVHGARTERLVSLCRASGATTYVSGPRAREYLEAELFAEMGIELVYVDYEGYPEYDQLYPPFDHHVTVLDLLFHVGADAPSYMTSFDGTSWS